MMNKFLYMSAALVLAVMSMTACDPEEGQGDGLQTCPEEIYLTFASEADSLTVLEASFAGTVELALQTNLPKAAISIRKVDEQVWCDASLNAAGDTVVITPGRAAEEELSAVFELTGSLQGKAADPVRFRVVRRELSSMYTLSISCNSQPMEGEYPQISVDAAGEDVEVNVRTNAERWYLTYTFYAEEGTPEWFSVSKSSGMDEESCILRFSGNDSGVMRNQMFVFSTDPAGLKNAVTLVVTQDVPASDASAVVIRTFDKSTLTAGEILPDGYEVRMPNTNTARSPFCFHAQTPDGSGIEVKFAEVGSDEVITGYPEWLWLFFGSKEEENEAGTVVYYTLSTMPNTGETRSLDAIVFPRGGGEELFRFRVVQDAASAR